MPNKRIQKALCNLNAYIDGDRQQLCDRIKGLEKSHKRMMKLLKGIHDWFQGEYYLGRLCITQDEFDKIIDVLTCEIERTVL